MFSAPAAKLQPRGSAAELWRQVDGHADLLVTGDKDLLTVADASPIPIVDPRSCWD